LEVLSSPLMAEGRKMGTMVVLRNITEKESIERVKSDFITIAAHKLRTPSSAIKWLSQGLIDGDSGELSKEQKEAMEKISFANQRIIDLVNNLLNSVEMEGGKYLSRPALFDIEEIILSVANDLREAAEKNNISIKMEKTEDKLPKIMIDKEKIKIAISDLLDNALKYNNSGGKVNIYLTKKDEDIIVAIKDTGIGMPKKEQDQIFLKFFRGEKAPKIDTEGKGLGLFIAKNIIEENGGSVWFESEEGKGSTFFFSLPVKQKYGEYVTEKFY
ncbi:MAG: HAMP domain-containing sensor histidine kinase, partial [Candidatus Nealsonbacteria bacterium]|nr:HAMP domain-containing sensor histidine kinase [Candidatus Nealsonbacteria bacterium]